MNTFCTRNNNVLLKKVRSFFWSLFFASTLLVSCNTNSNDKRVSPSVGDTSKPKVDLKDKTNTDAASDVSQSNLSLVKAQTQKDGKYVDWGTQPVESEDGPADPWTWKHMMCNGPSFIEGNIKASSTLPPQGKNTYSASNVCDDDPTTAWVEGKQGYGVGEFLEMKWIPMSDGEISILNGYQSSKEVWENNSRVKKMTVSVGGKDFCIIELADVMGVQSFKIPGLVTASSKGYEYHIDGPIRFTILEVYPGSKWKDTAISGIFSCGG